jgi:predicted flap endonuclease-1-like 5' DNA nuclease
MSACYRLVLDSVCRSNHHRIAVMALEHLKADDAAMWRDVFLKHRDAYLEGAKAPDKVFKDFKNHVCHVRDNNWGGAPKAAREWYNRTVRAMREQDWKQAAYSAGVMSHYAADPVQPFHTHQTEVENTIHRAVEWSLSKAFPEMFLILTQEQGFPDVAVPEGDDWLEQMVIAGAKLSTQHYETLIDHYNFAVGVKKPVEGLDQEMKDVVAGLLGYASVMLARMLDRAIAEAKMAAPKVSLVLDTVAIVASTPVRIVAKRVADVQEGELVGKQFVEFRKTGKVRETLGDDDKAVRQLFAEEVLKVSLSNLDCEWPREAGTAAGTGAEKRVTKKIKAEKAVKPAPAPKVEKPKPVKVEKVKAEPKVAVVAAEPAAPPPVISRMRLSREAAVVDAPSIGPKTAGRLNIIGVNTVGDLLALAPEDAAVRIKASHINAGVIKDWQAQALLACSVPELNGTNAQLLVGAGIYSVDDLATADVDFLIDAITLFAQSSEGQRATRDAKMPERARVKAWIEAALVICESRTAA